MALPLCGRRRFAPTDIFPMLQTKCLKLLYLKNAPLTTPLFGKRKRARFIMKIHKKALRATIYGSQTLFQGDCFGMHGSEQQRVSTPCGAVLPLLIDACPIRRLGPPETTPSLRSNLHEVRMLRLCGERFSHGGKAAFIARIDFRISIHEPFEAHTPGGRNLIINAQPPPPDSL